MGYAGETYLIPCDKGGLVGNLNIDKIPANQMVYARNININQGGRSKRGGTSLLYPNTSFGSVQVMSLFNFINPKLNNFMLVATSDGKVYKDNSNVIASGLALNRYVDFEYMLGDVYFCNGSDIPYYWDGVAANVTQLSNTPVDWASGNGPSQLIAHGYGTSKRLWAFGSSTNPSNVYVSANGNGQDFSAANLLLFTIDTGDGFGITGGFEWGGRLFAMGKTKPFFFDDSDPNTANWGYERAQWNGGLAHSRLIVKTPNDVILMSDDGEIYSVMTALEYGDYKAASITRPAFMNNWIKANVDLTQISKFHMAYDPILRAIKVFVVRQGMLEVDTALVFFIDLDPQEAWVVHDCQGYDAGYTASCSALGMPVSGKYILYTGDYSGNIWELEVLTNKSDNGKGYYAGWKTPNFNCDNPRIEKRFDNIWITCAPEGSYNLVINFWVDGVYLGQVLINLSGGGGQLDSFILDNSILGSVSFIDAMNQLGVVGKRCQLEVYNNNTGQDFFVSQILVDWTPLGAMSE